MRKTSFVLSVTALIATSVAALGQSTPENTTFFDYDFTATDQVTAEVDATGLFTGQEINRGPFIDGPLAIQTPPSAQVGFNNSPLHRNLTVDTAGGFAAETPTSQTTIQRETFSLDNL